MSNYVSPQDQIDALWVEIALLKELIRQLQEKLGMNL